MALRRMDNQKSSSMTFGGTIDFFRGLGLDLEGRATMEGEWAGRVAGLGDQRVEIAMMRMPDGNALRPKALNRLRVPCTVHEHSSTFLGGQSRPPSVGGRFDLRGQNRQPQYRITIPLQTLKERL